MRRMDTDSQEKDNRANQAAEKSSPAYPLPETTLPLEETAAFREEWFHQFVNPDKRAMARTVCFPKGDLAPHGHGGDHLWHAFGWRYMDCLSGPAARTAYDRKKKEAVLLYDEQTDRLYTLPAGAAPSSGQLEGSPHIYIADPCFSWTYSTGDGGTRMGPYFAGR